MKPVERSVLNSFRGASPALAITLHRFTKTTLRRELMGRSRLALHTVQMNAEAQRIGVVTVGQMAIRFYRANLSSTIPAPSAIVHGQYETPTCEHEALRGIGTCTRRRFPKRRPMRPDRPSDGSFSRRPRQLDALSRRVLDFDKRRVSAFCCFVDGRARCVRACKMAELTYRQLSSILRSCFPRRNRAPSPPEHDETLFIIIHQNYELWFNNCCTNLKNKGEIFSAGDLFGAIHTLTRTHNHEGAGGQVDILETMTPSSFSSFLTGLEPHRISICAISGN